MNWLKQAFFKQLQKLRVRFPMLYRQQAPYSAVRVSDLPDKLEAGKVYLVGENEHLWSAALKCPGGCGIVLEMNLVPDTRPLWRVAEHNGNVTIEPSIWRKKDCECHFRITNGIVRWY